jgi:hypothetical protein
MIDERASFRTKGFDQSLRRCVGLGVKRYIVTSTISYKAAISIRLIAVPVLRGEPTKRGEKLSSHL